MKQLDVAKIYQSIGFDLFNQLNNYLKSFDTELFFVGGCVRDLLMNRKLKDIDIIIPHIEMSDLLNLLNKIGTYDEVGASFSVIKFKPFGSKEIIDISLPRIEHSTGNGHKDFQIKTGKDITLEMDLKRRDFTINSMALNLNGNLIDLFNGHKDIELKTIKTITSSSFQEDPLRILRALQFKSRFDFLLSLETEEQIANHVSLLKHISGERVLIELEKGINGNKLRFAADLYKYNIIQTLFTAEEFQKIQERSDLAGINFSNNISEFLIMLGIYPNLAQEKLKISNNVKTEMQHLINIFNSLDTFDDLNIKVVCYDAINKCPQILQTKLFDFRPDIKKLFDGFKNKKFPTNIKELKINGNDLMTLGFKGVEIGQIIDKLLKMILMEEIENSKESLIKKAYELSKN